MRLLSSSWTQLAENGGTVKWMILWQQWETSLFYGEGKIWLTEPFTMRRNTDGLLTHLSGTPVTR